jgi:FMN phosphatase YigB (HAD superfamily)
MKIYRLPDDARTLLFDVDNTLYRNSEYYSSQRRLLISQLAGSRGTSQDVTVEDLDRVGYPPEGSESGSKLSLTMALCVLGIGIDESMRWREQLFHPHKYLSRDRKLRRVLEELASRYSLAAASNNPQSVAQKTLDALGVLDLFAPIIGADMTRLPKPEILPFQLAAEAHGVLLENLVSIGDRYKIDLETPLLNGSGAILVESMEDVYALPLVLMRARDG